ncbi:YnfU family zinc-binding protein [Citrobacter koseri]|uniref:YnfU family zinc-binding protein n=1 Tax=Citrobacter koseri TaxID=545 RepID=UPI001C68EC56|nr:YnfU family zinc-binding protein [Citrobacter koseri]MDT7492203.1 YnfU family zinc-binding protein [Citrobacter koseri]MDT7500444.1 YnfU family zinc-binding protein [Citrobacter koseri]
MSFLNKVIKLFSNSSNITVICPECGHKSRQSVVKINRGRTLICPRCKALFVASR